ncbi:MAG: hypothetical protein JWN44_5483 [Myxococcales bacterium]|nr:hypothetical protein [Myxococcales bacterium]
MTPLRASLFALFILGCGGSSPSPSPMTGGGGGGGSGGGGGGPSGGSWLTTKSGAVWSSPDGLSFASRGRPTDANLLALVCVNHLDGWAAGAAGTIIGTHDGGQSWAIEPTQVTNTLNAIAFADPRIGLAVGDGGIVLRTTDGGDSWSRVASGTTLDLYGVALSRLDHQAWIVGRDGVMLRSADQGASFAAAAPIASTTLRAVRVSDAGLGLAVGDGGLLVATRDGGTRWQPLGVQAPADLRSLTISDDGQRALAVGAGGLIWRSTDAALTWTRVDAGDGRALAAIGFSDEVAGRGWAVGERGALLFTSDDGASFAPLAAPADVDFTAVEDL